jgi:hypothetical protein
VPVQEIFFCLGCSSRPSAKYFFNSFVPVAQQPGQSAVLGRLSLSVCLWAKHLYLLQRENKETKKEGIGM